MGLEPSPRTGRPAEPEIVIVMHSTAEGEPVADLHPHANLERPRPRTPLAASGARTTGGDSQRVGRTSGDGPVTRSAPLLQAQEPTPTKSGQLQRFLRHRLTSPEKRTVKRIEALRTELFAGTSPPSPDLARAKILAMLREDRGLSSGLNNADAYELLANWLVDETLAGRQAAEIVGLFLREVGAMERPELSAPRVKAALRVLNEVLFGDDQAGALAVGVREFGLEKRDGGLQVVAHLRTTADEAGVLEASRAILRERGYSDVDVRAVRRATRR